MNDKELVLEEQILDKKTWQQAVLACGEWNAGEPERIAFVCGERKVSFAEYEAATDRIAAALAGRGIHAGKTVVLRMKRTERLFLALYGVVKSGAALLPIPEDMPPKRVEDIYHQVSADLTITEEEYDVLLREEHLPGDACSETGTVYARPEDTALILFTSGSTGKPKGVLHTQESVLRLLVQFPLDIEKAGVACGGFETVIAKTSINFVSMYIFEAAAALFYGKMVVILTQEEQNSDRSVGNAIESYPDTCIFLTPSQAESYLKSEDFCRQFKSLRVLILAGECTPDRVRSRLIEQADPALRIINAYGSTECALLSCRDERLDAGGMRQMPDTEVILADENGETVGEGEPGEIAVFSGHQFKGYVDAEARTVLKDGVRYFCTGDIGIRNADGTIVLRGRRDRMVKYHGMRVELADIEQNVCRFPAVRECAVVINRTEKGTEILSAFYVSADGEKIDVGKLREFLADYLPVSLIPVGMTQLDRLPLNANGKRDYKELEQRIYLPEKAWEGAYAGGNPEHTELLCKIVSSVTGDRALPEDNLFRLGMDSLMAFRIISELREAGLTVTVGEMFANPVLRDLAGLLQKAQGIEDTDAADRYPATGIQIYWGTDIDFNKKTRGLYVTEDILTSAVYTEEEFDARIHTLLKKHPALRMQVSFENGMPGQVIREMADVHFASVKDAAEGSDVPEEKAIFCLVDYADLRDMQDESEGTEEPGSRQKAYIENFKKMLLQTMAGSKRVYAFEAAYFRIREDAGVIIFTGNHASIDGTSMNILIRELVCRQLDDREDCYREFLSYIGKKENIGKAIGFYTQYLKGAEFSALPEIGTAEGGEEPEPVFKGITISLGEKGTGNLYAKSLEEGVSPVGYLMFTYGQALLEVLEKDALIMQILTFGRGVPVSGMDRAVGCFIEYVPVVIRREDTVRSFQNGNLLAEQSSFVPLPIIWKKAFGLDMPPKLAPFLISEVFPDISADESVQKRTELDYEKMFMGNFIAKKDGVLNIYFHFNAAKLLEEPFYRMTDAVHRRLKESCGEAVLRRDAAAAAK